jgi:hypothetical protein
MPEEVITSDENNNNEGVEKTNSTQEEQSSNPITEEKTKLRYKSLEEAEKAKNYTDMELDLWKSFTKHLTKEDALTRVTLMHEDHPEEVDRFYKETFGRTFSEVKNEKANEEEFGELKEKNPELYELKKELRDLKSQISNSNQKSEKGLIDEFISNNPSISKDVLEKTIGNLNPNLTMKEKVDLAVSIMAGKGQIDKEELNTYKNAYMKQSAGFVGVGSAYSANKERETEEQKMSKKFSDPSTFPPMFAKKLSNN